MIGVGMYFEPGDEVELIVGGPGPDTESAKVLEIAVDMVLVRYGPSSCFFTTRDEWVNRDRLMWLKGTKVSERYHRLLWERFNAQRAKK